MQPQINVNRHELDLICQNWNIVELSFFGSVIRDDFNDNSDIDILVEFHPEAVITLSKFERIRLDFENFFNRKVHLVSKRAVVESRNALRRNAVLSSSRIIYGA